jgi:hypothetical protein
MEVWPPGHKSPIHDHGNACAVIRVLSGAIQCTWYDTLVAGIDPIKLGQPVQLSKDQFTWLGENQYQIHALENTTQQTCVTLQCYEFPEDDNIHVEKFRYIKADSKEKKDFIPESDCTFTDFNRYMMQEWMTGRPYPTKT